VAAAESNEVRDDQKVADEAGFLDDSEFELEPVQDGPDGVGNGGIVDWFALTLTLSPREREQPASVIRFATNLGFGNGVVLQSGTGFQPVSPVW
jgi:hypothetical protein